jgi:hypothetical protein
VVNATRILAIALTAWLALAPSVALACPYCAKQERGGTSYLLLLGAMILFPFAVTGTVIHVLRKTDDTEDDAS